jgi:hypothetical protein
MLRVGDYNTKGLDGTDDDTSGNWARLTKMEGASSNKGAGGGSYGIGKAAVFVASALRVVYYASRNGAGELVFIGKAKLSSFKDETGDVRRRDGQFGMPVTVGVGSVRGDETVPEYFKREERGTDIYIAGYKSTEDNWRDLLTESILENFWAAIQNGDLVVELAGDGEESETIEAANLRTYLDRYSDKDGSALPYYLALTETEPVEKDLKYLGPVKLYVKTGEAMPTVGKVQLMRKPRMVVKPKRVRVLHENYAAVFICDNETGNAVLRETEPPAHDTWDPTLKNGKNKAALRELDNFLKEALRQFNPYANEKPEDIPDLGKYLADDEEERDDLTNVGYANGDNTLETTNVETPREVGKPEDITPTRLKPVQNQPLTIVQSESGGEIPRHPEPGGGGGGGNGGGGGPEPGHSQRIDASGITFRSFATRSEKGLNYHLVIKPLRDAEGSLKIVAVGEDTNYDVEIGGAEDASGKQLSFAGSFINDLQLAKDQTLKLTLWLKSNHRYALGVESYEN